jgi:methylenetetrahydrofolate dehydrogenase (NADP+)/methenyltetrahydrofolate cyclohydrolase
MAELLKGAPVAEAINKRTSEIVEKLKEKGIDTTLAILRVGENPADISYEKGAMKRCAGVGIQVKNVLLPENVDEDTVLDTIKSLNNDKSVHGILIFRPLPKHISDQKVRETLIPEKDIDGITDMSLAGVFTGSETGFAPCTAQACIEILDYYGIECKGKSAAVIGRSLVVGKPAAMMLLAKHATVTVCHTRTVNMPEIVKKSEIVIVAAGKAGAVGQGYFSEGQVVVDVGINVNSEGKLCGDVDFAMAEDVVSAITPVPGGVGTVTTSVLVNHVAVAAKRQTNL